MNLIRLCEKYFCSKAHDEKADQVDFHAWMTRPKEDDGSENPRKDVTLAHLERACSGARQDMATTGCPPILLNLHYYCWFMVDRRRSDVKETNGFIKILGKLLPSVEMRAYVRLMSIYDVAITRPHRFLAGEAHELHQDENGKDCDNDWNGTASMSDVADAIYAAMDTLVKDPKKMVDQDFMMSIFDTWLQKEINGVPNRTYLPKFAKWWAVTYIEDGRKTINRMAFKPDPVAVESTSTAVATRVAITESF